MAGNKKYTSKLTSDLIRQCEIISELMDQNEQVKDKNNELQIKLKDLERQNLELYRQGIILQEKNDKIVKQNKELEEEILNLHEQDVILQEKNRRLESEKQKDFKDKSLDYRSHLFDVEDLPPWSDLRYTAQDHPKYLSRKPNENYRSSDPRNIYAIPPPPIQINKELKELHTQLNQILDM